MSVQEIVASSMVGGVVDTTVLFLRCGVGKTTWLYDACMRYVREQGLPYTIVKEM
jgi:hypothetical protein